MNDTSTVAVESDSAKFSRALRSAILWPVGAILFTALLMLAMIILLFKVVRWSEHSYEVISQSRTCESLMADSQSGLRGFLLTDASDYPHRLAQQRAQVDTAFLRLAHLVTDNPTQKIRAENLVRDKDVWFEHAQTVAEKGSKSVASWEWMKMGDELMRSLRGQFQTITQAEENVHDQRIAHVRSVKWAIFFAGGTLAPLLGLTVWYRVRRQFFQLAVDHRSALHTTEQRHTALLRSEADLEEQKEWFRVTLTSIGDGVIVTDKESRIVFMNHEAERLTGWNNVESLLKPLPAVYRVIDEKTREKGHSGSGALPENREAGVNRPAILISKTGKEWPIDDSSAPISDNKGNNLGVVLVFRNATDIRRAQNELRMHSEDLEKRVTERTTALRQTVTELESFSYTVSHDLRSPLRAMQGFAQAVVEDYGDRLDEQGRNYLYRIKNAAERLDRLIQDLLSYTRIAREDAPLHAMDLDKLIRELVEYYPNLHPPVATVEITSKLPTVLGREASLTQIFSNLLGNAAKFVAPGSTSLIRVWSEDQGDRVRIWIEDDGIGIAPADYERIFQMFVQVNGAQDYGGTGVGLAIVKKAVESMHGSVGLAAAEKGTRFWVELVKAA